MIFIPAIDIIGGKCVRLAQGDYARRTVYSENPVKVALDFRDQGAEYLHVIDLDAAQDGGRGNIETIKRIIAEVDIPVQVGGGVRGPDRVKELIETGAERIILGTVMVKVPDMVKSLVEELGQRLVAGIDAKNGVVRVSGWQEDGEVDALFLGRRALESGFSLIIYTDITTDGMLQGPNVTETRRMAHETGLPVIAAGGVKDIGDIRALLKLEKDGVIGVISGRAIYEGTLSVREACRVAREGAASC